MCLRQDCFESSKSSFIKGPIVLSLQDSYLHWAKYINRMEIHLLVLYSTDLIVPIWVCSRFHNLLSSFVLAGSSKLFPLCMAGWHESMRAELEWLVGLKGEGLEIRVSIRVKEYHGFLKLRYMAKRSARSLIPILLDGPIRGSDSYPQAKETGQAS